MLRLLGFVVIVVILGEMAPWGMLVGAILFVGWLLLRPAPLSKTHGLRTYDEQLKGYRRWERVPERNSPAECCLLRKLRFSHQQSP